MKVITHNEVELDPNEQWVAERLELHLDAGMSLYPAAIEALLDFWYAFPGSENDTSSGPFTWQFYFYLCGHPIDRPLNKAIWQDASLVELLRQHAP